MCALAARFPVAILSDRRADDIEHRAQGSGAWTVFGHHAMWLESSASEWSLRRRIVQWRNRVSCALGVRSDIWIEDKEFALALHYRGAPHEDEARRAIAAAVDAIDGAQVVFGNRVVTISPAHSPSKPTVLKRILHDFGCHAAIYVGDDAEDEPVFRLKDTIPLLGIRIGDAAETSGLTSFKDSATSTDC
jgi:trehalose 6-phosphate phosphatase